MNIYQRELISTYKKTIGNDSTKHLIVLNQLKKVELKNDTLSTKNIILESKVQDYKKKYTPIRDLKLMGTTGIIVFILTKFL